MICLDSLLSYDQESDQLADDEHERSQNQDDADDSQDDCDNEIGAVFPCGHVFHLKCWHQWQKEKCPYCMQEANLFSKLFIGAPPLPQPPSEAKKVPAQISLPKVNDNIVRASDEEGDEDDRHILLDMRTAEQDGPAKMIQKVVSLGCKMRRLERHAGEASSELESTKLVLQITQEELELTNQELQGKKAKLDHYKGKLARIQAHHWQRHQILHDELVGKHKKETKALQKELAQVKADLALRNRQIAHWTGRGEFGYGVPGPES